MGERKLDGRTTGNPAGDAKPGGRAGKRRDRGDLVSPKTPVIVDRKPSGSSVWDARAQVVTGGAAASARGHQAPKSNPSVKKSGFTRKPKKR